MSRERRGSYEGHSALRDLRGTGKRFNLTAGQGWHRTRTHAYTLGQVGKPPLTCKSRIWLTMMGWQRNRAGPGLEWAARSRREKQKENAVEASLAHPYRPALDAELSWSTQRGRAHPPAWEGEHPPAWEGEGARVNYKYSPMPP